MDALDQQLLALLRMDAHATVATLAGKLGVSRGTVTNRIARLEDGGVITGYTVRLRPDSVPDEITAWMSITVDGNRTREVVSMLLGEPGITGLWQVSGRSDLSWEESVRLDLSYVENWSIMQDLTILWRTVWAVARKDGAY